MHVAGELAGQVVELAVDRPEERQERREAELGVGLDAARLEDLEITPAGLGAHVVHEAGLAHAQFAAHHERADRPAAAARSSSTARSRAPVLMRSPDLGKRRGVAAALLDAVVRVGDEDAQLLARRNHRCCSG